MNLTLEMFRVEIEVTKNKMSARIAFDSNDLPEGLEYAFYLMHEEIKTEVKYYSKLNYTEFQLIEDGEYYVVGFVKWDLKKLIKKSEKIKFQFDSKYPITVKKKLPISIFGSCVSRDLFEFDREKQFELKTYIARQSIVSAVSPPLPCNMEDIQLKSIFQKKAVYNDFVKETFSLFKNDGSKYLMIDLIDERFSISKYSKDGIHSIITYSSPLQESNYINKWNLKLNSIPRYRKKWRRNRYFAGNKALDIYLEDFCNKILEIYKPENIILHKGKMVNYYRNKDGEIKEFPPYYLNWNKKVNDLIQYMYDFMEKKFTNCFVIDFCDEYYADEEHRWGLAPMHYQKEYYIKIFEELEKYISEQDENERV